MVAVVYNKTASASGNLAVCCSFFALATGTLICYNTSISHILPFSAVLILAANRRSIRHSFLNRFYKMVFSGYLLRIIRILQLDNTYYTYYNEGMNR